jgi:quercetin dioxygenase-like cupin family protein
MDNHPEEEFVFTSKGQPKVRVQEGVFRLEAGDSMHYQGSQPHAWRNESRKESMLIQAFSPLSLSSKERGKGG